MSLKDLFDKGALGKTLVNTTVQDLIDNNDLESRDYLKSFTIEKERILPAIDFATASNFAHYGSAEKYYEKSFDHIQQTYPYDGSRAEKMAWENSSSFLDLWVLENVYPKKTGYITLNETDTYTSDYFYSKSGVLFYSAGAGEYVLFKGGPHADPYGEYKHPTAAGSASSDDATTKANIYDTAKNRSNNLEVDLANGITVEFWNKKTAWGNNKHSEVLFNIGPTGTFIDADTQSPSYGEVTAFIDGDLPTELSFRIVSGSTQVVLDHTDVGRTDWADSNWHHYALTAQTVGGDTVSDLYVDGNLQSTVTHHLTVNEITGAMIGAIGALSQEVSGSGTITYQGYGAGAGWAPCVSASFDEFRFWKTKRSATEIGRNWFRTIGGGTNTDDANTKLGVYYKFNEGITYTASVDQIALDYSGRLTDGQIIRYNTSSTRNTGSALVDAGFSEEKDPVIYSFYHELTSSKEQYRKIGRAYDQNNSAALINFIPNWIIDQEDKERSTTTSDFTQVLAFYFDELHAQIKEFSNLKSVEYTSGSNMGDTLNKPNKMARRVLSDFGFDTPEIFTAATYLEDLNSQSDEAEFNLRLDNIKNFVYQNVYKNLQILYKSKGTERSINNLLRCMGTDQDLIKVNVYADGQSYELKETYKVDSSRTKAVDFNNTNRFKGSVYQYASSAVPNSSSYISASSDTTVALSQEAAGIGYTYEVEVVFPNKADISSAVHNLDGYPNISSSLFGFHEHDHDLDINDLSWKSDDQANVQLYTVRDAVNSRNAQILLTSSAPYAIQPLTSSLLRNLYDGSHWVLAFRIKPEDYPQTDHMSGTTPQVSSYKYDVFGATAEYDTIDREFETTGTITYEGIKSFLAGHKTMYAGAHYQDFSGSILTPSDVKILSCRVYYDYLDNETLREHARDVNNIGTRYPSFNLNQFKDTGSLNNIEVPNLEACVLNWSFNNNTGSDSSGQFLVYDETSGSLSLASDRYGWYGNVRYKSHTGRGDFFPASSTSVIDIDYISNAQQQLPEVINSTTMVQVLDRDDLLLERDSRPVGYFFSVEKSLSQVISQEILTLFAGMRDFNDLYGQPYHRYRQQYKSLAHIRQLVFEQYEDVADVEKFINYYKWFDNAIVQFIHNLVPATAKVSQKVGNMIESHVLERNKYWNKFPTLEPKVTHPEGVVKGYEELDYSWKFGHAPVGPNQGTNQNESCLWWKDRAARDGTALSSGDSSVDSDREAIRQRVVTEVSGSGFLVTAMDGTKYYTKKYQTRALSRHLGFKIDDFLKPDNVSMVSANKKEHFYFPIMAGITGPSAQLMTIARSALVATRSCSDNTRPPELDKKKIDYSLWLGAYGSTTDAEIRGTLGMPFSFYTSSVKSGYQESLAAFQAGVEINNYHSDDLEKNVGFESTLQSPFTEKYVGGHQRRHVPLNAMSGGYLDQQRNRPENWGVVAAAGLFWLASFNDVEVVMNRPRALYTRDPVAKRPVNIANIHLTGTGKNVTQIGNYEKKYQYFQTVGRHTQKSYLREFPDGLGSPTTQLGLASTKPIPETPLNTPPVDPIVGPLSNITDRLSSTPTDTPDVAGTRRSLIGLTGSATNQTIFVNKFSAPGGYEAMSRGFLDPETETYSAYNAMPWRNRTVRDTLDAKCSTFSAQFGFQGRKYLTGNVADVITGVNVTGGYWTSASDLETALDNPIASASFHKTHRNTQYKPKYSGDAVVIGSSFDNFFVQHPIPASDRQYAWITASLNTHGRGVAASGSAPFGFATGSSEITFLSGSEVHSMWTTAIGPNVRVFGGSLAGIAAESANVFMFQPFNNLNYNIHEPITGSSNTLGYPTLEISQQYAAGSDTWFYCNYINDTLLAGNPLGAKVGSVLYDPPHLDGRVDILNSIILKRQGPYGWPSWKQIRGNEHPITRYQRDHNIISTREIRLSGINQTTNKILYQAIPKNFTEPPIQLNMPVREGISMGESVELEYPLQNNLTRFSNNALNFRMGVDYGDLDKTLYRTIYKGYTGADPSSPIKGFSYLNFGQPIYPRQQNMYLSSSRGRQNNIIDYWRDLRGSREVSNAKTAANKTMTESSMWVLDARNNFKTATSFLTASTSYPTGGYGQLQNPACIFHNKDPMSELAGNVITASALYARPNLECNSSGLSSPFATSHAIGVAGDTLWEAGAQAAAQGKIVDGPFYESYADYVSDMKGLGKSHSIIPEFRISEHMDYYINEKGGEFIADNAKFLSLTGAAVSSSGDSRTESNSDFYKIYSNSDFLKMFPIIKKDHDGIGSPSSITLECKALMKFLPYNGFYPAQRTVQLASLFSQSYADNIVLEGASGSLRTVYAPFFAPGILYNTIKSGIAVDYPIMTSSWTRDMTGSPISVGDHAAIKGPRISSSFDYRVPFEAILQPEVYLKNRPIVDMEPNPSASLDSTGSIIGVPDARYSLAMHNFLAETVDFFLPEGKMSSLTSLPEDAGGKYYNVDKLETGELRKYKMRIVLSHAERRSRGAIDFYVGNNAGTVGREVSVLFNPSTIQMYSNQSASLQGMSSNESPSGYWADDTKNYIYGSEFGPPCVFKNSLGTWGGSPVDARFTNLDTRAPFTPPYYNSYADIELTFTPPHEGYNTLDEILSNLTITYERMVDGMVSFDRSLKYGQDAFFGAAGDVGFMDRMMLSSTLNFLQQIFIKREDGENVAKWSIQPKFETPILDFKDVSVTEPGNGVEGYGKYSTAKGMWHQYGQIPAGSDGLFMSTQDLSPDEVDSVAHTGSLKTLVGFPDEEVKLGVPSAFKIIREAVVAIPFKRTNAGQMEFYPVKADHVSGVLSKIIAGSRLNTDNPMDLMVRGMTRYVIPPKYDFLTYQGGIDPFAMYFFEFEHTLDQKDLTDIWQNLPPDSLMTIKEPKTTQATISHPLVVQQFFSGKALDDRTQWLVFKVKQKAKRNYYLKTNNVEDDENYRFRAPKGADVEASKYTIDTTKRGKTKVVLNDAVIDKRFNSKYSYNWPYDFFSMVELVKMDATIKIS